MKKTLTTIVLASLLPLSSVPIASAATSYTVKPADTLWKISQATGVATKDLIDYNSIKNPDVLFSGQVLQIPTASDLKRLKVVKVSTGLVDSTPYVWGGETPGKGMDCSGFTKYVFQQIGIQLPHSAHMQANLGTFVPTSQLQLGDLVFFKNTYQNNFDNQVTHVGIYIGNGMFVQESSAANRIIIRPLWGGYYEQHYYGAKRFIK